VKQHRALRTVQFANDLGKTHGEARGVPIVVGGFVEAAGFAGRRWFASANGRQRTPMDEGFGQSNVVGGSESKVHAVPIPAAPPRTRMGVNLRRSKEAIPPPL